MTDRSMYAVFLHPQAIEALGPAIQPYLLDSPGGKHLQCSEVDSGGALFEMTLIGRAADGRKIEVELMVPTGMIRLVISVRQDDAFGFNAQRDPAAPDAASPDDEAAAASPLPATTPGTAPT